MRHSSTVQVLIDHSLSYPELSGGSEEELVTPKGRENVQKMRWNGIFSFLFDSSKRKKKNR